MSIGTIILIILVLALVGVLPTWGHSSSWGYGPSGGIGLIVVCAPHSCDQVVARLRESGETAAVCVGTVVEGDRVVHYES